MLAWADRIDRITAATGRTAAWCVLLMVAAQFAVVVLRYAFGIGSVWLQESIVYAHATLILLAATGDALLGRRFRRLLAGESRPPRAARWQPSTPGRPHADA